MRLESKHPCLSSGDGGYGLFNQPVFRLLKSKPSPDWGPKEQGALRSAVADRQWPQAWLKSAGMVSSPNCQLCVRMGLCDANDNDPIYKGTLLHRL